MKIKFLLPMAFSMLLVPKLVAQPHETYAFMMGGGANNACDVMIPVDHEANYDVTLKTEYGTETVPFLAKFNPDCAKVSDMPHAVAHINNGTNLFFLQQYGDMVGYMPVAPGYQDLYKEVTSLSVLPNNTNNTDNKHGSLFVGYSVPRNDTSCGATHGKYKPICDDSNHYGWGHALKSYTTSNLKALATAIKKGDQSKINSLTGEYEFIGYSTDGTPLNNTYFPSEYPVQYIAGNDEAIYDGSAGSGKPNVYPFVDKPWEYGTAKTSYDNRTEPYRTAVKEAAIGRLKEQEKLSGTVSQWMNKLSLKNNASAQAGVFEGREKYGYYNIVVLEAPSSSQLNMAIMEMTLYDGKEKIASFTRDAIGLEFGATWIKKDNKGNPIVLEGGKEYTLEVKVTNGSDEKVSTSHKINTTLEANDKTLSDKEKTTEKIIDGSSSSIAVNGSQTFKTTITMPNANGIVTIDSNLDEKTYSAVNFNRVDDNAEIVVQVQSQGDISVCDIKVFTKGGTKEIEAKDLVQDREYDVEYYICYDGNENVTGSRTVKVQGTLETSGTRYEKVSLDREFEMDLKGTNTFRETIRVSNPEIITNIKISTSNNKLNKDKTNDSGSLKITNAPNIKLDNLKINPSKIIQNKKDEIVTISYDLTLEISTGRATLILGSEQIYDKKYEDLNHNYNATYDIETLIKIGNQEFTVSDKIKEGEHKYTHTFPYKFPSNDSGGSRDVTAIANINQNMYEWTMDDNDGKTRWEGIDDDGAQKTGCPVGDNVRNEVKWDQTYTIDTIKIWKEQDRYGNDIIMQEVVDTRTDTFRDQMESLKITGIQMRSKLQQDLGLGNGGWIDVIEITDSGVTQINVPKIKAGYGFEIRFKAEYTSNVLATVQQEVDTNILNSGEDQRIDVISAGAHDEPNLLDDFYIYVGGKTVGKGAGLSVASNKVDGNENKVIYDITITPKASPNTQEEGDDRIYISENTRDGRYNLKVFSGVIGGLSSRTDKEEMMLCDEVEIEFEVIGGVYDDLNSHQTN